MLKSNLPQWAWTKQTVTPIKGCSSLVEKWERIVDMTRSARIFILKLSLQLNQRLIGSFNVDFTEVKKNRDWSDLEEGADFVVEVPIFKKRPQKI